VKVATSRYQNGEVIVDSGLAPVRITLGHPRWQLPYTLAGTLLDLAPERAWMKSEEDVFERHMNAKLFRVGATRITEMVESMAIGYAGVVLLCYEKIPGPDFCHRTMVADWMNTNLGWDVQELEDRSKPSKPRKRKPDTPTPPDQKEQPQGSLFEMPVSASRAVIAKAEALILAGKVHRGVGGAYFVEPSSGVDMYTTVVDPPSCTCQYGESGRDVKLHSHWIAAEYLRHHGMPPVARKAGYIG